MFCQLLTLVPVPGRLPDLLRRLEAVVAGPSLLGCWTTVLGHAPRVFVLRSTPSRSDHAASRDAARADEGLFALADATRSISIDTYATLPCLPEVAPAAHGAIYEFRIYQLQPQGALQAALEGWAKVIQTRLALAPIAAVMHSVDGAVPRLVHIYPYRDLQHRLEVREQAIATGVWPPKGGSSRNLVMAAEIAVPALFSPLH